MFPLLNERASDSPLVSRVWSTESGPPGAFSTIATGAWSLVVASSQGRTSVSVHGPVTRAVVQEFPPEARWFGIEFRPGAFAPATEPGSLADGFVVLPSAAGSFSWGAFRGEVPTFENADTFVSRLVRAGFLEREPLVFGAGPTLSPRMAQYRFARATGLSRRTMVQIDRARAAAQRLLSGASILDTVAELGYSDQPHLTRALRRFIGLTPAEVARATIVGL